jgi:rubredoxin
MYFVSLYISPPGQPCAVCSSSGKIDLCSLKEFVNIVEVVKKMTVVKRYKCRVCNYIYSPLRGEPHNGIPAGTAFEDLPDTYVCPICGMEGKGKIGKWGFDEWVPTRWICSVCGYVYDQKRGEPHRGIKAGTAFEDLPETYTCPVCALDPKISVQFGKVFKQGFEPLEF